MAESKVAVVTGSNKGIGYAIVKGLCQKFSGDVFLTARDESRGLTAVKSLNDEGYHPKFHQLDITDPDSVNKLRDYMAKEYGGIDILVNNAAIAFKVAAKEPFDLQAKETIRVNYFGLRDTCNVLFPLLRPHARVVNVSSSAGVLNRIPSERLRSKFSSSTLTEPELSKLMESFVKAAQTGDHVKEGWPDSAYSVSKVGVSALTIIQQREINEDKNRPDILINAVHPGYVATDMSSYKGTLTIEEGAEAPLYLALLPKNISEPKGGFVWYTKEIVDWTTGPLP